MATGETGHNVQSWTKRRAQGCKKFPPGPSWLLLSKTGPPLSPSWQLVTLHFTVNCICLSPVDVLLGLPDEEHVALLALGKHTHITSTVSWEVESSNPYDGYIHFRGCNISRPTGRLVDSRSTLSLDIRAV